MPATRARLYVRPLDGPPHRGRSCRWRPWLTGYAPAVTRLAGPDRYATSAAVAATYSAPQPSVYIASGANFPDALSGAPVAGMKGVPLLLVAPTSLPAVVRAQLLRLAPSTIVILGSTGSVSQGVADQLAGLPGGPTIVRYGGVDRYDTSAAIVDPARTAPGQTANYSAPVAGVFVATGADFPDALSAAPLAGSRGWPLLLVRPDRIPGPVQQALAHLNPQAITILGGTGSVSKAVQDQLVRDDLGGDASKLTRIAGVDRYATSAAISAQGYAGLPPAPVTYIATGTGFPDALSGAPLAAKKGVPLLLVRPTSVPAPVGTELTRLKLSSLVVLGGPGSVTDGMLLTLSFYLDAGSPPPGCPIFPASNVWNVDVSGLPVASNSATMIAAIGSGAYLHPDFDAVGDGIPYNVVSGATPASAVSFSYSSESDHVPYPIPANPLIEGGSDRHLLMVDPGQCRLWELFAASKSSGTWHAGSGATWDLTSNALRPAGWTSADAAGLPIYAGLVRYDEVSAGAIAHALRFTAPSTCASYIYPALHEAGSGSCASKPPMGLRVRLKAAVEHLRLRATGEGRAHRAEDLRHDPRRQRLGLVRERGAGRALGRRRPALVPHAPRQRLRGRGHQRPGQRALTPGPWPSDADAQERGRDELRGQEERVAHQPVQGIALALGELTRRHDQHQVVDAREEHGEGEQHGQRLEARPQSAHEQPAHIEEAGHPGQEDVEGARREQHEGQHERTARHDRDRRQHPGQQATDHDRGEGQEQPRTRRAEEQVGRDRAGQGQARAEGPDQDPVARIAHRGRVLAPRPGDEAGDRGHGRPQVSQPQQRVGASQRRAAAHRAALRPRQDRLRQDPARQHQVLDAPRVAQQPAPASDGGGGPSGRARRRPRGGAPCATAAHLGAADASRSRSRARMAASSSRRA